MMQSTNHNRSKESGQVHQPPDGGWGWVVVIAGGIGLSVVIGFNKAISLVYEQMLVRYGGSAASTATAISLNGTIRMVFSPLASLLVNKTSNKTTGILAGVTCALSLIVTAFMPSLVWICFTFGIIYATGIGMYIVSELSMVNLYFSKNRGKANALESCFMGVGALYMTQLLSYLFDEYGYRGTLLIVGAIHLHLIAAAGFYRPLNIQKPLTKSITLTDENEDSNSSEPSEVEKRDDSLNLAENPNGNHQKAKDKALISTISSGLHKCAGAFGLEALRNYGFCVCAILMCSFSMATSLHMSLMAGMVLEKGFTKSQLTLCMTLSFAAEIMFRLTSGVIFDLSFVRKRRLLLLISLSFILGLVVSSQPYMPLLVSSIIWWMLQAGFMGAFQAQSSTVLSDSVPRSSITSSLGLMRLIQSFGHLSGPFFGGLIRDLTGSYMVGYIMAGVQLSFLSACSFIITVVRERHKHLPISVAA